MKKVLLGLGIAMFGFSGFALADAGHDEMPNHHGMGGSVEDAGSNTAKAMMRMDTMMGGMMLENRAQDCAALTSGELMEKGEAMMGKMFGGDEAKHERIEVAMETESEAFHDEMHIMMGRNATGCFTDEQQKAIAGKLQAVPQSKSGQGTPLVAGLVIGVLLGLVGASFMKKKTV